MRRPAALVVLLAALGTAGCVSRVSGTASPDPAGSRDSGAVCEYREKPDEPAPVGLPPKRTTERATTARLSTTAGELVVELTPDTTQCTVRSFAFLVREGFYEGTACHRLTAYDQLKILQCGNPHGTDPDGLDGGPGYTIPDEYPEDLEPSGEPSPVPDGPETVIYPRGTVAMANGGPNTGGSQFFVVYGDSAIPPTYAVLGTVGRKGLGTLDEIAAAGVRPGTDPQTGAPTPEEGAPLASVVISSASVD